MTNNTEDSESIVDFCVDGECSAEDWSRLERLLETDEEARREYDGATRLRELFREAANASPPAALKERVRSAIDSSDFWNRSANRSARRADSGAIDSTSRTSPRAESDRTSRNAFDSPSRFRKPGVVGAVAASVALVVGAVGTDVVRRCQKPEYVVANDVVWTRIDLANKAERAGRAVRAERVEPVELFAAPLLPEAPVLRIPAAAGDAPESTAKRDSDEAFWADYVVRAGIAAKFSRFCASSLNIEYSKENGDSIFRLKRITPEQWRAIDRWFAENGGGFGPASKNASRATVDWADDPENATVRRDVRVALLVVDPT